MTHYNTCESQVVTHNLRVATSRFFSHFLRIFSPFFFLLPLALDGPIWTIAATNSTDFDQPVASSELVGSRSLPAASALGFAERFSTMQASDAPRLSDYWFFDNSATAFPSPFLIGYPSGAYYGRFAPLRRRLPTLPWTTNSYDDYNATPDEHGQQDTEADEPNLAEAGTSDWRSNKRRRRKECRDRRKEAKAAELEIKDVGCGRSKLS